jgi:spore coat protein SA
LAIPILATNNGGTPEIVENDKNGFLLNPFSPDDLSEKIEFLLENDNKRLEMGKMAKAIVERKFGINRMIEEFYSIYKEVI